LNDYSRYIADLYDRQEQRQGASGFNAVSNAFYQGSDWLNFGYWRADTASAGEAGENLVDELLALKPPSGGLALDVGCGKGMTARRLCGHFEAENVFGINISREHLAKCAVNAPNCTFLEMDATAMEFPDESFEYVISVEAAFHFQTREKFFAEALRVLRPGGKFVLSDILTDRQTPHQPPDNRMPDLGAYHRLFDRIGFIETRIVDATEPCSHGFNNALLRFFEQRTPNAHAGSFLHDSVSLALKERVADKLYVLAGAVKP
jgi:ubiquinone/menaquinone biosynthesis C-methylase UbiE